MRHLDIRSEEHTGMFEKEDQTIKYHAVYDHLLRCNMLPSFDSFSIIARENKNYLLEIKESLRIMRDKLSLNRNINSAPLQLFDKVSYFTLFYLT